MEYFTTEKKKIEAALGAQVEVKPASDGGNLMAEALQDGRPVARIYKSFNACFEIITQIRYTAN